MNREMKDSGVEWIGEIPQNWRITNLKNLVTIYNGKDNIEKNGSIPVYGSGGVFGYTDKYIYDGESVLMGRKGTIDKPRYVNEKFWTVDTSFYTIPKNKTNMKYFYFLASAIDYSKYKSGSTVPSMTQTTLNEIKLPVPNITKQSNIAYNLENMTKEIEWIIEKTKSTIEDYKLLKQSIITEAVTKGLDKNAEMKDSGIEWIGKVPRHWEIKTIKQLSKVHSSTRIFQEEYSDSGIPFYRTKEIVELANDRPISAELFISQERYDELKYKKINKFDILISSIGTIGEVWICDGRDFYYKDGNITQIDSNQNFDSMYMKYVISSRIFKEAILYFASTTTISALSIEKINRVKVPIPPIDEQKRIIEFIDEKCNEIVNMTYQKEKLLLDLEAYKKSLIYEYVTGKKVVE